MKKRIISGIAAVVLTFSGVGTAVGNIADLNFDVAAIAAEVEIVKSGTCGKNLTWTFDSEGTLTISGTGDMTNYDSYMTPWKDLDDIDNTHDINIKNLVIEDGVTSIGNNAFSGQTLLENVTIPDSVTDIGENAFDSCFRLTSINIPVGVTNIDQYAFYSCEGLTNIDVSPDNKNFCSVDGVLYDKSLSTLLICPRGKTGEVVIPDSVTSISEDAFTNCAKLTSVTIPDGVKNIGDFFGCKSLKSINIPNSVTSIGNGTFINCKNLTSITIPDSIKKIDRSTFENCQSLTSITIPDSVTEIGDYAFMNCTSLTSITIPDSVTSIGFRTFYNCNSLASITIPKSVTNIDGNAFGFYMDYNTLNNKKLNNFKIYCYKGTAGEKYAKNNGINYELIAETDPAATHPKVVKIEKNGEFHQFRLKWNEIEGAAQYGIAVKISGKWKVQAYTDKNYFTSPRLRPGSIVEMVICAKVNGKWDTSNINGRAFKVAVK